MGTKKPVNRFDIYCDRLARKTTCADMVVMAMLLKAQNDKKPDEFANIRKWSDKITAVTAETQPQRNKKLG